MDSSKARERERKWQKRWEERRLFESEPEPGKGKFFITVAYPYPSGGMHVGHVRTYTVPDIVARFKRMQGFNVLFPMAWHVTGTPIIGAVNRVKEREPRQMRVLKEVFRVTEDDLRGMKDPMGYANHFITKHYTAGMRSLGYTIDWRRQFTTNDSHYNRFIEWQHGILYRKGLEKKGLHPVKWCTRDENPVTTHDLLEGESADIQEFTLLKFPIVHGKLKTKKGVEKDILVAATLRPETIFGQTNMWVNPETEYVRAEVDGERWIVSRECAEKLSLQKKKVRILGKVPGRDLIGKRLDAPGVKHDIPVLPSGFCDPKIGTGIVTCVPSDAPYDWIGLKDIQKDRKLAEKHSLSRELVKSLEPIPIIDTKRYGDMAAPKVSEEMGISDQRDREKLEEATKLVYREGFHKGTMNRNCGKYAGMKVEKAKELVRRDLLRRGKASTLLEFSEPVVCRCGGEVVVARKESWFIDYSDRKWKALARKCLKGLRNVPPGARKEFEHTIEWLEHWPCVRNYGLGTPLPQDKRFIIEPLSDSTIYMAYYLIAHRIRDFQPGQLVPEFFDYVMLGKGPISRVSGKTGIPQKELRELRKSVDYWYPLDWRCSALELIPNHLTFMIFHHTAIFPEKQWPRGIATWGMGLLEGGKMSSSKGNVVLASDAIERHGADAVRFFLFSSSEPWQDFDWRRREVESVASQLGRWEKRVMRLWDRGEDREHSVIDRWLLSELSSIVRETTKSLEAFETRKASLECFFRMSECLKWYERRCSKPSKPVIGEFLSSWVRMMTPFVPHLCEELWEHMGKEGFISQAQWPRADAKATDPRLGHMESFVRQVSEDITSIIGIVGSKPKAIRVYVAPAWKHVLYNRVLSLAKTPERIIPEIMKGPEGKKHGKDALRFAQRLSQNASQLRELISEQEELSALEDAKGFLEREFKCPAEIIQARVSDNPKALRAEPGKPGIEVLT